MRKKKVCMVGDFAVGKTSLTQKFVNNVFSEKYLTTVGVKIDSVVVGDTKLIVWDIAGRDPLSPINAAYLTGAAGVILVGDGTRPDTLESLADIFATVQARIGVVPMVVALNKRDADSWAVSSQTVQAGLDPEWEIFETSAKDGLNVETMFNRLVEKMNVSD